MPLVANLSILFRDTPVLERFAAAREAGFDQVESWWPFASAAPSGAEIDGFVQAAADAGTALRAMNLYAGDQPAGERGVLSDPARVDEFRASLPAVREIAERTGCRLSNALYGQRIAGVSPEDQDAIARENLVYAARALAPAGVTLLLEALRHPDNGDYPLRTLDDAEAVRSAVAAEGATNVGLLFDTFHLAGNGVDLVAALRAHSARIAHVQLADAPGRGAPGTGSIDFPALLAVLEEIGYDGLLAAEFAPGDGPVSRDAILAALDGAEGRGGRHH
jgi:hydroxypyruvate isomerase